MKKETRAHNRQLDLQNDLFEVLDKWWKLRDGKFNTKGNFYDALNKRIIRFNKENNTGIDFNLSTNYNCSIFHIYNIETDKILGHFTKEGCKNFNEFKYGLIGFITSTLFPESELEKAERQLAVEKEMSTFNKELFDSSINELTFERMQTEYLENIITEIEALNKDKLLDLIIKNGLERHMLDKLIHSREVFDN